MKVLKNAWDDNESKARILPKLNFVNLLELIADKEKRVPPFTNGRKIISQDREHLTKPGAKYIWKILFETKLLCDLK